MVARLFFIFFTTFLWVSPTSCTKDESAENTAIPDVEVNEKISINDLRYDELKNINGWTYLEAGSKGVILFRESNEIVRAFERHCTYDAVEVCSQVDMDAVLLQANDFDCCGSVFSIISRSVINGPASKPLLEYDTEFDGTFVTVTN